jgi:hypothetical protein
MTDPTRNGDGIIKLVIWFIRLFVPPHEASARAVLFWRWRIAIFLCTTFVLSALYFAESHLAIPYIDPLVHASALDRLVTENKQELKAVEQQELSDHDQTIDEIHETRAAAIEAEIATLRPEQCKTTSAEAKQLYWERISHLMEAYQQLVNRPYALAPCPEIQ